MSTSKFLTNDKIIFNFVFASEFKWAYAVIIWTLKPLVWQKHILTWVYLPGIRKKALEINVKWWWNFFYKNHFRNLEGEKSNYFKISEMNEKRRKDKAFNRQFHKNTKRSFFVPSVFRSFLNQCFSTFFWLMPHLGPKKIWRHPYQPKNDNLYHLKW